MLVGGFNNLEPTAKSGYNDSWKEGELMVYHVAIVDDSITDAEFVQGILNNWGEMRQKKIQTEVFSSAEAFLFLSMLLIPQLLL